MLKYNIRIAIRNLKRNKGSFFINLIGLSTGLTCAILIYLWVNDEINFDKFHKNDKQLYQVMELSNENNINVVHEQTQGLLADVMAKDLPEVQSAVSVMKLADEGLYFTLKTPDKALKAAGIFARTDRILRGRPHHGRPRWLHLRRQRPDVPHVRLRAS